MKADKNEEACVLDMTMTKSFKDAMRGQGVKVKKTGGIGVLMKQATRNFDPKNREQAILAMTESLKEPGNCGNSVRFQVLETLVKTMDDDEASVREVTIKSAMEICSALQSNLASGSAQGQYADVALRLFERGVTDSMWSVRNETAGAILALFTSGEGDEEEEKADAYGTGEGGGDDEVEDQGGAPTRIDGEGGEGEGGAKVKVEGEGEGEGEGRERDEKGGEGPWRCGRVVEMCRRLRVHDVGYVRAIAAKVLAGYSRLCSLEDCLAGLLQLEDEDPQARASAVRMVQALVQGRRHTMLHAEMRRALMKRMTHDHSWLVLTETLRAMDLLVGQANEYGKVAMEEAVSMEEARARASEAEGGGGKKVPAMSVWAMEASFRISASRRNTLLGGGGSRRGSFRDVGAADNLLLGGGYTKVVRGIWMCASNFSEQVRERALESLMALCEGDCWTETHRREATLEVARCLKGLALSLTASSDAEAAQESHAVAGVAAAASGGEGGTMRGARSAGKGKIARVNSGGNLAREMLERHKEGAGKEERSVDLELGVRGAVECFKIVGTVPVLHNETFRLALSVLASLLTDPIARKIAVRALCAMSEAEQAFQGGWGGRQGKGGAVGDSVAAYLHGGTPASRDAAMQALDEIIPSAEIPGYKNLGDALRRTFQSEEKVGQHALPMIVSPPGHGGGEGGRWEGGGGGRGRRGEGREEGMGKVRWGRAEGKGHEAPVDIFRRDDVSALMERTGRQTSLRIEHRRREAECTGDWGGHAGGFGGGRRSRKDTVHGPGSREYMLKLAGEASHMTGRIITFRYRSESARADSTSPPPVTGRGSGHDATKRQKDPSSQNRGDSQGGGARAENNGLGFAFGWKAVSQTNIPPPSSPPQPSEKNEVVSPGRGGGSPGGGGADGSPQLRPGTSMRWGSPRQHRSPPAPTRHVEMRPVRFQEVAAKGRKNPEGAHLDTVRWGATPNFGVGAGAGFRKPKGTFRRGDFEIELQRREREKEEAGSNEETQWDWGKGAHVPRY